MKMKLMALDRSAEHAADFLRAVAHPGRLRIVCALVEGERTASELARGARMRAPALSQQAAILEAGGLIARRRQGQSVLYRLVAPEAKALAGFLHRLYCKQPTPPAPRGGAKRAMR